ncbi:DUF6660 family protein [Vaginella massiliensis]|uniref:DUF6660 family protein n=1 Tax=Vaginella massiliensis TaxID=1816680 RepID=UPI000838E5F8
MQCHCITFLLTLQKNMKVFYSILAIYMMTVFLMPCTDMYEKDNFQNHNHSEELTHQGSHDHQEKPDICSPFCLCGCCGMVSGIVLQWNVYNLVKAKTFELSKPEIYYKSIFIPCYFGKIWQPPKVNA